MPTDSSLDRKSRKIDSTPHINSAESLVSMHTKCDSSALTDSSYSQNSPNDRLVGFRDAFTPLAERLSAIASSARSFFKMQPKPLVPSQFELKTSPLDETKRNFSVYLECELPYLQSSVIKGQLIKADFDDDV